MLVSSGAITTHGHKDIKHDSDDIVTMIVTSLDHDPQMHIISAGCKSVYGALTWVVGALESVIVFVHTVHDGFPVVVDLVE